MNRTIVAAAATLLMSVTLSPGAGRECGAETTGPAIVRLVETSGAFEPKELELRPGKYIFMVTNQGVDHPVDFVLTMTKSDEGAEGSSGRPVRNSRLSHRIGNGETASSGVVEMKPGTYTYGSPLNPTPEFTLTVRRSIAESL